MKSILARNKLCASVLAVVAMLVISSCARSLTGFEKEQQKYIKELVWVLDANPEADFQEAIAGEDYRFKGIYGYSITVPGLKLSCLDYVKDIEPLDGTTDAVLGYEHAKLIAVSRAYALFFNQSMLQYRVKEQGFSCDE